MLSSLARWLSLVSPRSWVALIVCALGVVAVCGRIFDTDEARTKRAQRKNEKELGLLAEKISAYGQRVHQRYPAADVVVSERDLAEQLRKRPDAVVSALNHLLIKEKVQKAPLNGYWRLNA
jgi:hypothetical protein